MAYKCSNCGQPIISFEEGTPATCPNCGQPVRAATRTTNPTRSKGGSSKGGSKTISAGTSGTSGTSTRAKKVGKKPRRKTFGLTLKVAGPKLGQRGSGESKRRRKSPVRKFFRGK